MRRDNRFGSSSLYRLASVQSGRKTVIGAIRIVDRGGSPPHAARPAFVVRRFYIRVPAHNVVLAAVCDTAAASGSPRRLSALTLFCELRRHGHGDRPFPTVSLAACGNAQSLLTMISHQLRLFQPNAGQHWLMTQGVNRDTGKIVAGGVP